MAEETDIPVESATIHTFNPKEHIKPHTPAVEPTKDVGSWFYTEQMELNFGDYVGRPDENVIVHRETLSALFNDGWYVTEVKKGTGHSAGVWQTVSSTVSSSSSNSESQVSSHSSSQSSSQTTGQTSSQNHSESQSSAESQSSSNSSSQASSNSSSQASSSSTNKSSSKGHVSFTERNTSSQASGQASGTSFESATGSSSTTASESASGGATESASENTSGTQNTSETASKTDSQGETSSTSQSASGQESAVVTSDGDPYWCAYSCIRLERRRMQAERALKDMVKSFVSEYNKGREINDERYEELVGLYALLVNSVQSDLSDIIGEIDLQPLFDEIEASVKEAMRKYAETAEGIPDDWLNSRISDINRKFDALLGKARARLVSTGMFNATVFASVEAGVERDRQYALNNLKDEMVTLKVDVYGKIASMTSDIGSRLIDAKTRVFEALQKQKLTPLEMRNNVFKWMFEFMERRNDEYPGLADVAALAERLGFSGGIGFPVSSSS